MKRNRGILSAIAVILVVGILLTCYTRRLLRSQEGETAQVETQAQDVSSDLPAQPSPAAIITMRESASNAEKEQKRDGRSAVEKAPAADTTISGEEALDSDSAESEAAAPQTENYAAQRGEDYVVEAVPDAAAEGPAISPLEQESDGDGNLVMESSACSYEVRLQEIDVQIEKMREQETNSNTNSIKMVTDSELKLWDSELNTIYSAILEKLNKDEVENLVKQQRDWMMERDSTAVEAAKKHGGGSMEGVEYTASLVASTRDRAYELAEKYRDILENE